MVLIDAGMIECSLLYLVALSDRSPSFLPRLRAALLRLGLHADLPCFGLLFLRSERPLPGRARG